MPASIASWRCWAMSWVKIGVSASSPITTPAWRAEIVQPPWIACGARPAQRGLGQRREHQGQADPDHHLRRHGQRDLRLGQQRQPAEPAGDEDRAGRGARPGAGHEPVEAAAEQRRQRHHADHDRGADRAQAPALDQEQHEQEEGAGDRRRDQRQGQVGEQVRPAGPAQLGREHPGRGLVPGDGEDRHRGGERDRHLDQEDRLPGDQLGEQAADRRAQRRPGRPRGRPDRRGAPLGADRRRQQLQHRGHRQRRRRAPARSGPRSGC